MNAVHRLLQRVSQGGAAPALKAHGVWHSWADLDAQSIALARAFMAQGVRSGDRLCAVLESSPRAVCAFLAAWRMGAVWVPINPGYGDAEREHIVTDAQPALVLTDALLQDLRDAPGMTLPEPPPDQHTALLIYTSGTTGKSKGCMLSARNVVDATESLMEVWRMGERDVLVHALPLFHVHGLCVALCGALLTGARVHLLRRFDVPSVLAAFSDGATVFMGVPTMYRRLLDELPPGVTFAGARLFCSGSAPLPTADFEEFERRTGHRIVERYGMSETLITLSNPVDGPRKPGTVGLPLPGVQLRLVDDELWLKGPGVMSGYWRNANATAQTFTEGWLKTGDAARQDDDGYVTVLGRVSTDFLKVGGYKISTREVEDALRTHPQVRDVAVVGVPDREWGQKIVACVVPGPTPPTLEQLFVYVELHAAKKPRALLLLDALPRNAMGKVQKKQLEARAAAELS